MLGLCREGIVPSQCVSTKNLSMQIAQKRGLVAFRTKRAGRGVIRTTANTLTQRHRIRREHRASVLRSNLIAPWLHQDIAQAAAGAWKS